MEAGLLHLHNFLRWVVLIAGVIAIVRAFTGMSGAKPYNRVPGTVFLASVHIQVLIGAVIYWVSSGIAATFRADVGAGMKVAMLRFFGMEHVVGMVLAAVVVTIGSARARRGADDAAKNKTAAVFFTIGLLLILAVIPWPFRGDGVGRPLFPGMKAPATEPTSTTTTTPSTTPLMPSPQPVQPVQPVQPPMGLPPGGSHRCTRRRRRARPVRFAAHGVHACRSSKTRTQAPPTTSAATSTPRDGRRCASTRVSCGAWWSRWWSPSTRTTQFATAAATTALTTMLLTACDGPPPLSPEEVQRRWRHGQLIDAVQAGDDVDVVVVCPAAEAAAPSTSTSVTARFRLVSREVRLWERRDPLGHRDPLAFMAWRRCAEQAEHAQASKNTTTTTP